MTRFSFGVVKLLCIFGVIFGLTGCGDDAAQFQEGTHYINYPNAVDDQLELKPELAKADVIEFFTYGCHHCQAFAPKLVSWHDKNPDKVIEYVPVVWSEQAVMHAKVFYLIQRYSNFEALHHELFDLVAGFLRTDSLEDQKVKFIVFFESKGIEPKVVLEALDTSLLDAKTASSVLLSKRFEISGTPTVVINRQYRVNNKALSSKDELFDIVDEIFATK